MKDLLKRVFLMILVLCIIIVGFGCTPKEEPSEEENLSVNLGFLKSKNEDDNSIVMEYKGEGYMVKVDDNEVFDSLIEDEFYLVAYTDDGVLKSIKANPSLKELVLETEDEPLVDETDSNEIYPSDKISLENLTLLDEYAFDFDRDKVDEKISLYTAAQRDDDGEIMWDDGQRWLFVVQDTEKDYILFDGWVQLGGITSFTYTVDDDFYLVA